MKKESGNFVAFSSMLDALDHMSLFFGFRVYPCCGRNFSAKNKFPWEEGKTIFWVLCGLPGTGKSTFASYIEDSYPHDHCKIIERDTARMDLLWDSRKDTVDWKEKHQAPLDDLTTELSIERMRNAYYEYKYHGIVIDGCHTEWRTLKKILDVLSGFSQATVNLVIVGSSSSKCMHNLSDRKTDDYGDYIFGTSLHTSLPKEVFEKKQLQMKELCTEDHFKQLGELCDNIYLIPAYQGK